MEPAPPGCAGRTLPELALKLILAGSFASEVNRKRFPAEAGAAAHPNHPNIVPIFAVGELDGLPFYSILAESISGLTTPSGRG